MLPGGVCILVGIWANRWCARGRPSRFLLYWRRAGCDLRVSEVKNVRVGVERLGAVAAGVNRSRFWVADTTSERGWSLTRPTLSVLYMDGRWEREVGNSSYHHRGGRRWRSWPIRNRTKTKKSRRKRSFVLWELISMTRSLTPPRRCRSFCFWHANMTESAPTSTASLTFASL